MNGQMADVNGPLTWTMNAVSCCCYVRSFRVVRYTAHTHAGQHTTAVHSSRPLPSLGLGDVSLARLGYSLSEATFT